MKIRDFKRINEGKYYVAVTTEEFSEIDLQKMQKFGEPEIDCGGSFTNGLLSFTLPNDLAKVRNDFNPRTQVFDVKDFSDAQDRAALWLSTIISRLNTAMTTLRAQTDTFTGEDVSNV